MVGFNFQQLLGPLGGQPQQVQAPMNADPMQGMSEWDRFKQIQQNAPEVFMGLGAGLMSGNPGAGFAAAGAGMNNMRQRLMEQQKTKRAETATVNYLKANGFTDAEIEAGIANPAILTNMLKGQTGDRNIINAGSGNLYDADKGEWLSAPGGGSESRAGLQTVWMRDANGNPVIGQLTQDGKVLRSEVPDGLTPMGPYDTSFQKGAGGAAGEVAGGAQMALPAARQVADRVNTQVNDLKSDPYLPRMLGPMDSRLPSLTADAARVQSKIDQLNSGAFLEARQALKGGGAITDFESQKAEAALARLNTAQHEGDFKAALDEFNMYIQQGLQKLEAQAGTIPNNGAPIMQGGGNAPPSGGNRMKFDANGNPL